MFVLRIDLATLWDGNRVERSTHDAISIIYGLKKAIEKEKAERWEDVGVGIFHGKILITAKL